MAARILTVNTGSSSLKAALYDAADRPKRCAALEISRIGAEDGLLRGATPAGSESRAEKVADHTAALELLAGWLRDHGYDRDLAGAGHRVVHGGPKYSAPQLVTAALLEELKRLIPIDPMHLPQACEAMEELGRRYPRLSQVACFDTAFHRTMPSVAQTYPLPLQLREAGLIRYGFHGLSYEYIMSRMAEEDPGAADGRIVIAHLGNGASMAAVAGGRSMDTTMGFTPTGGLVMGTRTGDLDPGVLLYLLQNRQMSAVELNVLVNNRSGLLGLSGATSDMQDLLRSREHDPAARLAVDVFCYSVRKFIGALAAALGGLDTLIFTGGIGEHAPAVREEVCRGLEFIGVALDHRRNMAGDAIISRPDVAVTVRVMQTDEDSMIAEHTVRLLQERGDTHVSV